MKNSLKYCSVLLSLFLLAYMNSCVKEATKTAPVVVISDPTNITNTSAVLAGEVMQDGGSDVTARGICWSTSPHPTIEDSKTTEGEGLGIFNSTLTGLVSGQTYYVRAYATNSAGTSYSSEVSFETLGTP